MKCYVLKAAVLFILLFPVSAAAQLMNNHTIDSGRRVTFTVNAPNASEVKIINLSDEKAMGAPEYRMKKGSDGIWTVTTNPCRPGFHYYELSIDGYPWQKLPPGLLPP